MPVRTVSRETSTPSGPRSTLIGQPDIQRLGRPRWSPGGAGFGACSLPQTPIHVLLRPVLPNCACATGAPEANFVALAGRVWGALSRLGRTGCAPNARICPKPPAWRVLLPFFTNRSPRAAGVSEPVERWPPRRPYSDASTGRVVLAHSASPVDHPRNSVMRLRQAAVFHVKRTTAGTGVRPAALPRSHDRSRNSPPAQGPRTEQTWLSGSGCRSLSTSVVAFYKRRRGQSHAARLAQQRRVDLHTIRMLIVNGCGERCLADVCDRLASTNSSCDIEKLSPDLLGALRGLFRSSTVTHSTLACRFAPLVDDEYGLRMRGGCGCFT